MILQRRPIQIGFGAEGHQTAKGDQVTPAYPMHKVVIKMPSSQDEQFSGTNVTSMFDLHTEAPAYAYSAYVLLTLQTDKSATVLVHESAVQKLHSYL